MSPSEDVVISECRHEPDPTTIEWSRQHGRRARCRHCGTKLSGAQVWLRPGGSAPRKRLTSRERRQQRREG